MKSDEMVSIRRRDRRDERRGLPRRELGSSRREPPWRRSTAIEESKSKLGSANEGMEVLESPSQGERTHSLLRRPVVSRVGSNGDDATSATTLASLLFEHSRDDCANTWSRGARGQLSTRRWKKGRKGKDSRRTEEDGVDVDVHNELPLGEPVVLVSKERMR